MILNLIGGGAAGAGNGAGLNVKIVGNPQPASPKENTIWVNTDTEITSWVFSTDAPENPEEGMVHFCTSSAAVAEFNALKHNGIYVYPTACMQYENGAWVPKEAMTYQDGSWKRWSLYLYDAGTFYDGSGTLTQRAMKEISSFEGSTCNITYNADSVKVASYSGRGAVAYFNSKIDLTPFSTLYFNGKTDLKRTSNNGAAAVGVWSEFGDVYTDNLAASLTGALSDALHMLDISNLSGEFYVGLFVSGFTDYVTTTMRQLYLK